MKEFNFHGFSGMLFTDSVVVDTPGGGWTVGVCWETTVWFSKWGWEYLKPTYQNWVRWSVDFGPFTIVRNGTLFDKGAKNG